MFQFLDCTLRDGGYYNDWDFDSALVTRYLHAVEAAGVDIVELGFRFVKNEGFKGPSAYTTDQFLEGLNIPDGLTVAVMLNASDLYLEAGLEPTLEALFPRHAVDTPVEIVRIACHAREFTATLPAADWLAARGYRVGFNLMQITERTHDEVVNIAAQAAKHPIEVLYFADSMGGMTPDQTRQVAGWMREAWDGPLGVHTHDNMGLALQNTQAAMEAGVTWLDATVTGMGRGPGNARTEELAIELAERRSGRSISLSALMDLVAEDFAPMKSACGWGTNPFYYLSGKYGIHPTYLQEVLADPRFSTDDVLAVIDHLRQVGGAKFDAGTLDGARQGLDREDAGNWNPVEMISGRPALILGNGGSAVRHRNGLETFIDQKKPVTMGLNTLAAIDEGKIDLRLACHPLRISADIRAHSAQTQPLVTPTAALTEDVQAVLSSKSLKNFGLRVAPGRLDVSQTGCTVPARLVGAYALAVAIAGQASQIYLAGFDGFASDDPRASEMQEIINLAVAHPNSPELISLTPTRYRNIAVRSLYGMIQ